MNVDSLNVNVKHVNVNNVNVKNMNANNVNKVATLFPYRGSCWLLASSPRAAQRT